MDFIIGQELVDKDHPLPWGYRPSDLVAIPEEYRADDSTTKDYTLRKEALLKLIEMFTHAMQDRIRLYVVSAFRSAEYQEQLYKEAVHADPHQKSTAAPCYSEHQLGTAVDITSDEVTRELREAFSETRAYRWMKAYAGGFYFYESYAKENHRAQGYIWEPWHWRYWGTTESIIYKERF